MPFNVAAVTKAVFALANPFLANELPLFSSYVSMDTILLLKNKSALAYVWFDAGFFSHSVTIGWSKVLDTYICSKFCCSLSTNGMMMPSLARAACSLSKWRGDHVMYYSDAHSRFQCRLRFLIVFVSGLVYL